MRALVLHGIGDLRLEDVPRPAPGPGEVLVRVAYCGVCGSDIPRVFVKGTYRFPTICGHEFAGTIEQCGAGVAGYQPGDRVAVFPLVWCGRCAACERGAFVMCSNYDYYGSRRDGAFAEFVAVPAQNLLRVPEGVSLAAAALTEPAAVALHAVRRAGRALVGQTAAIFGAGPIGLLAAQWARRIGADQVILFDPVAEKLATARRLGFTLVFDPTSRDPIEVVSELTAGQGAEVCIEAAGVPRTFCQAIGAARAAGRVVLLGNPSADVTLPAALISQAMRRELDLVGVWNSSFSPAGNNDDWHAVMSAAAERRLELEPLVTHRVPLENAPAAFAMMRDRTEFFAKVLVEP